MIKFILIVVAIAFLCWLFWRWWQKRSPGGQAVAPAPVVKESPVVEKVPEEPVSFAVGAEETPEPDDLKRIEGIGPKISALLQENGILTFAQLAATDTERLSKLLMDAGLRRLADPATWPEQAGLAAAGKWEELEKLQDELQGGRRE